MTNFSEYKYLDQMGIKNPSELKSRLRNIKHVALDMDGTIYNGKTLFPFTIPFLNKLKELNISYSFLTNNPSKSVNDYLLHLKKMGIPATEEEIYTSAQATIEYLKYNLPTAKRLFILGTPSMIGEFQKAGYESTEDNANDRPDAVVVGFDMSLAYSRLCRAAWWLEQGLPYIATNPDKVCPTDQPTVLVDCGSICSCLNKATERVPNAVAGKPDPRMLGGILKKYKLQPSEIAMVGDRLYTDIKMASDANCLGVLVLSGESVLDDVKISVVPPGIIADHLGLFGEMLQEAKKHYQI